MALVASHANVRSAPPHTRRAHRKPVGNRDEKRQTIRNGSLVSNRKSCATRASTNVDATNTDAAGFFVTDFNGAARGHAREHASAPMSLRLTRELGLGDGGTDVALLQRLLGKRDGHGVYDKSTADAVARWQRSRGLTPSGFFGMRSREQLALEEETWRENGGRELLVRLHAEALDPALVTERRSMKTNASTSQTTTTRTLAPSWSVHASHGAVAVFVVGALGASAAAGYAKAKKRERRPEAKEEEEADEETTTKNVGLSAFAFTVPRIHVTVETLTDALGALGVRCVDFFDELSDAMEYWRQLMTDAVIDLSTDESPDEETLLGSYDAQGRWWESPISPMASKPPPSTAVKTGANFTAGAGGPSSRERAERMRERWVHLRGSKPRDPNVVDERQAIKRVSEFLGDSSKPQNGGDDAQ